MASLYQNGSSGSMTVDFLGMGGLASKTAKSPAPQAGASHKIVKIRLPFQSLPDPQDVDREGVRIEFHIVSFSLPDIFILAEKIVDQVRLIGIDS